MTQFEIGMESGEVEGHVRAKVFAVPGAELVDLGFGVVLAGDE